jgi:hypothetical protein
MKPTKRELFFFGAGFVVGLFWFQFTGYFI